MSHSTPPYVPFVMKSSRQCYELQSPSFSWGNSSHLCSCWSLHQEVCAPTSLAVLTPPYPLKFRTGFTSIREPASTLSDLITTYLYFCHST